MSIGGGKSKSKSNPVTWKEIMTPYQKEAMKGMSPYLQQAGIQALQGFGLSPEERTRQKAMLSGDLAEFAGGMRQNVRDRSSALDQRGGVVSGAQNNIDAAKVMAYGQGLRNIEDMNQQLAQQKIANLLSFVTWNPPVAMKSKSSGFNLGIAAK